MSQYIILGFGFLAQILFASRMFIQWIQSEKSGSVVSPPWFWKTSLMASAFMLVYGLLRHDAVIIIGQILSYFIYIRNLQLNNEWKLMSALARWCFLLLPSIILAAAFQTRIFAMDNFLFRNQLRDPLLILGGIGQLILNLRFVYQWYKAEKSGFSILTIGFWILSCAGSLLVMVYAIYRFDPVLLIAQGFGITVYTRNISIYLRSKQKIQIS